MLIAIIKDSDLNIGLKNVALKDPTTRYASRGIILNENGEVGLVYKSKKNEYKLPGGGIEDEDPKEAFKREVLEETGCIVKSIKEIGTIEEHKGQTNFKQISHVFVGKIVLDTKTQHLTQKEKIEGTQFLWTSLDNAIKLVAESFDKLKASSKKVTQGYESVYMTQFVIKRDQTILKYYKEFAKCYI